MTAGETPLSNGDQTVWGAWTNVTAQYPIYKKKPYRQLWQRGLFSMEDVAQEKPIRVTLMERATAEGQPPADLPDP